MICTSDTQSSHGCGRTPSQDARQKSVQVVLIRPRPIYGGLGSDSGVHLAVIPVVRSVVGDKISIGQ